MKDTFLSYIPRSFISIFQRGFEPLSPSHLLILLMFLSCWLTSSVNVCICWYRACICRNGILFVLLRKHVIWFSPPCIDCVFRKFTAHFLFKRKYTITLFVMFFLFFFWGVKSTSGVCWRSVLWFSYESFVICFQLNVQICYFAILL